MEVREDARVGWETLARCQPEGDRGCREGTVAGLVARTITRCWHKQLASGLESKKGC